VLFTNPGKMSIVVVISVIVIAMVIETSITRISVFVGGLSRNDTDIAIFSVFVLVFGVGQYLIMKFINFRNIQSNRKNLLLTYKLVFVTQFVLLAMLLITIIEMLLTASYSVTLTKMVIWINYAMSIILLGLLAERFFAWFRSNRNRTIFVYAIGMSLLSINSIVTILYVSIGLAGVTRGTEFIGPLKSLVSIIAVVSPQGVILNQIYLVTSILSFITIWVATIFLLYHYTKKIGRIKYWIIVSIPLVYFLSQFQYALLEVFTPLRLYDPILFGTLHTFFFSAVKPVGGILFGLVFWIVYRNIRNEMVKDYMMISGFGLLLLFSSNQPFGLTLAPYPPFGLATICFVGLSSFLIYAGIYSSALSVANDVVLRRSIRKSVEKQSDFLEKIGTAEEERQISNRILVLTRELSNKVTESTGVQSSFQDDQEIKDYLQTVLEETKRMKQ
jgi:hypothetical protein